MLICIWLATVFLITGMIPVHINSDVFAKHTVNLNLIPFYGGAFVPMVLNVMMFMPIGFVIHDAGRMLYNLNSNELFWGSDSYQKSVDYTNMDKSLEDYRGEILSNYDQLNEMIIVLFHRRG